MSLNEAPHRVVPVVVAECVMQERMHRKLQKKKIKRHLIYIFYSSPPRRGEMVDLFFSNANDIRCFLGPLCCVVQEEPIKSTFVANATFNTELETCKRQLYQEKLPNLFADQLSDF